MKWRNISCSEKAVDKCVKFLDENNIKRGEPFETDGIWRVPYLAIGKVQQDIVNDYIVALILHDEL